MDILKDSLEEVVVPIFCTAKVTAEEGAQTEKLDKVGGVLWMSEHCSVFVPFRQSAA